MGKKISYKAKMSSRMLSEFEEEKEKNEEED